MPFTGSHPAAVLPFFRVRFLLPSALAIGSMAPDLPYFVPLPFERQITHTALGVVTTDLEMGFVVFVVWHVLVARAVVAIAPRALRARLPGHVSRPRHYLEPARLGGVILSLIIGGFTHIGWDSLTHDGGWGPTHIPWLLHRFGPLPAYRWAQYGSGVVGAVILALAVVSWWRATPPDDAGSAQVTAPAAARPVAFGAWAAVVVAGLLGGFVAAVGSLSHPWGVDWRSAAFLGLTRGGTASGVVLIAFAIAWAVATGSALRADRGGAGPDGRRP